MKLNPSFGSLWQQAALAMVAGIVVGVQAADLVVQLKPLGSAFVNAIKMLMIPLVFFSLIAAITSLGQEHVLGRQR